jgi:hypothetical protein
MIEKNISLIGFNLGGNLDRVPQALGELFNFEGRKTTGKLILVPCPYAGIDGFTEALDEFRRIGLRGDENHVCCRPRRQRSRSQALAV